MAQNTLSYQGQIVSPLNQAVATTPGLLWTVDATGVYQLFDGLRVSFFSPEAASGQALTLAVSGLPAKAVVRWDLTPVTASDIGKGTQPVEAIYSLAQDKFLLVASNVSAPAYTGSKNLLINGAFRFDQRWGGALQTLTTSNRYICDKWAFLISGNAGTITSQQTTATDGPAGFPNYMRLQTTVIDASMGSTKFLQLAQRIEGNLLAALQFGTGRAQSVSMSFWVRSSLTGLFAGSIQNAVAGTRSYVFNYTINAANTWELKTVTIPGDVVGTWVTNSGLGMQLTLDYGSGTNFKTTANVWTAGQFFSTSGTVNITGTLNATFDITGVQLEAGSIPTNFERLQYTHELVLCQRYFGSSSGLVTIWSGNTAASTSYYVSVTLKATMRAAPSVSISNTTLNGMLTPSISAVSTDGFLIVGVAAASGTNGAYYQFNWTADADY